MQHGGIYELVSDAQQPELLDQWKELKSRAN
jgi:hypothetical protein